MAGRVGVLADIHGNIWALEAVLRDAKEWGVTGFVNLGDMLYGPLKPRETFDRLLGIPVVATIQGNQDRQIYEAKPMNLTLAYVIHELGDGPIDWLMQLPTTAVVEDRLFLCHGTPASDTGYLLEDVSLGQPSVRSDAAILELLEGVKQPLVLCGHTHIPRLVGLSSGQLVLNPGSVGLPAYDDTAPVRHAMENYAPHASYAIVENDCVSFRRVAYDHESAARQARALGREDWAQALATGRMSGRD